MDTPIASSSGLNRATVYRYVGDKDDGRRFQVFKELWLLNLARTSGVMPGAKATGVFALNLHLNKQDPRRSGHLWMTHESLAKQLGMKRPQTVGDHMAALVKAGFLKVAGTRPNRSGRPINFYQAVLPTGWLTVEEIRELGRMDRDGDQDDWEWADDPATTGNGPALSVVNEEAFPGDNGQPLTTLLKDPLDLTPDTVAQRSLSESVNPNVSGPRSTFDAYRRSDAGRAHISNVWGKHGPEDGNLERFLAAFDYADKRQSSKNWMGALTEAIKTVADDDSGIPSGPPDQVADAYWNGVL